MTKTAWVFGGSGQVGSYMCEFLRNKGYHVYAPSSAYINFVDSSLLSWRLPAEFSQAPDEIYNFAAKTSKKDSWDDPAGYMQVNGLAVLQILEAIAKYCPKARFFNAGSADVFSQKSLQRGALENSDRGPTTPYGLSKCVAEDAVCFYRHFKGLHASTGIFFNMESPRRNPNTFVRHVCMEAARLHKLLAVGELKDSFPVFGNLGAVRDWGLVSEYVEAAWLMLQADVADDYIIATGESHTCNEFVEVAFEAAELPRLGYTYYPTDGVDEMRAYPHKINAELGWRAKSKFKQVVRTLVQAELEHLQESSIGQSNTAR